LIRDIPVYVLWLDSVAERKDELLLAWEQADKIIVDSGLRPEINTDTTRFFPTLLGIHRNQDVLFADLAWQRVTPLREAVATLFDTEEDLPRLGDITSVELARVPRAEAYLIQYWLASRLNWETDTRGFRDATGREVAVAVGEESEVDINRAFVSLGTADGEEYTASADGSGCIHLTRPSAEEQETRVYTVPAAGEALLNEVDDVKVDQVYLETVSLLASTSAV
jgi:glucose-6-phosphate dehydrogenase assembly protein OpcA